MKPRALDLFCGAGGAGMGLHQAGFEVVGVDIAQQPRYPFEFHQADALTFPLDGFDLIWASPPCQGYSNHVTSRSSKHAGTRGQDEPRLIAPIRDRLLRCGAMYAIENVAGAKGELRNPAMLCGTMFGLPIARHRYIESSPALRAPSHRACRGVAKRFAVSRGWESRDMTVTGKGRRIGTADRWSEILGITWPMSQHELREAIPPAYSKYIAEQILHNSSAPILAPGAAESQPARGQG